MSSFTIRPSERPVVIPEGDGALLRYLEQSGKFPPVTLSIFPLEDLTQEIFITSFISYKFQSSILVPVDAFSCEIYYEPIDGAIRPQEGDVFVLKANGLPIASGVVDQLDMETDGGAGTRLSIQGRDLLGKWEDDDAVNLQSQMLFGNLYTIDQVVRALSQDTRINPANLIKRNAPKKPYLFATQPGESKLSAMQRYCEALDIYFWMSGDGNLIIGKPDMYGVRGGVAGTWFLSKEQRRTNVLSIRSTRNSTSVPGQILPIWNGQESVQDRIKPVGLLKNTSKSVERLWALGHRVVKAQVVSTPQGSSPQDLAEINTLRVAGLSQNTGINRAGASTILQAYAKREMARHNLKCLQVQITVPGHYNDRAAPLEVDQVYRIQYDIDGIDEDMFLYECEYTMAEGEGQRTRLYFCQQNALVSDVRAR